MVSLFARGVSKPVLDRSFPLEPVDEVMDMLARGEQLGKLVVTVP